MRDGVRLNAILYRPDSGEARTPVIQTMTPYTAQALHDSGKAIAARGYAVRVSTLGGAADPRGVFTPNIHEAEDGYDVVEWVAQQSYCDGKVALMGGSYMGYAQWATAKEFPPHLASIWPLRVSPMRDDAARSRG